MPIKIKGIFLRFSIVLYIEAHKFSLCVLYTEIYHRKFNPKRTSSECSGSLQLFLSLSFYLRAYFSLYHYVSVGRNICYDRIFILTLCLLPPPLRYIILQNIFLFPIILLLLLPEKIASLLHITLH